MTKRYKNCCYYFIKIIATIFPKEEVILYFLKKMILEKTNFFNHSFRVGRYSKVIAESLELEDAEKKIIENYSIFHDIGKVFIPKEIMDKEESLTNEEFEIIKTHTIKGYEFCKKFKLNEKGLNLIKFHHERWDGKGYPNKLVGTQIPLVARIYTLCDIYDALREKRIYKDGFSHEEAVNYILEKVEEIFDPNIVKIFKENEQQFNKIYSEGPI